jgi:hypothetical protein
LTGKRGLESWKRKEEGGEQNKSAHLRVCVLLQFPPERKWVVMAGSSALPPIIVMTSNKNKSITGVGN